MKKALIIGGASGIGLSIANQLARRDDYTTIIIIDKKEPVININSKKIVFEQFDLTQKDYSIFDKYMDINLLMITAGFGKLGKFSNFDEDYIEKSFEVNTIAPIKIIKKYYNKLLSKEKFFCGIMVSIAGFMSSPLFSIYASSKAALKIFIESVNVELLNEGSKNQILNISPGSIKGTGFYNNLTDLSALQDLTDQIVNHLENQDDLFIPQYEEIFKNVLDRYHADFRKEGQHSYEYKLNSFRN